MLISFFFWEIEKKFSDIINTCKKTNEQKPSVK